MDQPLVPARQWRGFGERPPALTREQFRDAIERNQAAQPEQLERVDQPKSRTDPMARYKRSDPDGMRIVVDVPHRNRPLRGELYDLRTKTLQVIGIERPKCGGDEMHHVIFLDLTSKLVDGTLPAREFPPSVIAADEEAVRSKFRRPSRRERIVYHNR